MMEGLLRPYTAQQFLNRGLEIKCSGQLDLRRFGNEAILRKFKSFFTIDPAVMSQIWHDLQTTPFDPINEKIIPEHLLMVYCWLTSYDSEDKLNSSFGFPVKQVIRVVLESLTKKVAALRQVKVSVRINLFHLFFNLGQVLRFTFALD